MITYIHTFKMIGNGLYAVPVTIETEISNGIGIHLVGLADNMVKESLLRTVTALQAAGYHIPGKTIIINLPPADLLKNGSGYDLPIALGVLSASEQESLPDREKYVIAGKLALDGRLRAIPGWMQAAELAQRNGLACILPTESAKYAACALGDAVKIYGANNLREVIDILNNGAPDKTAADECQDAYSREEEPHLWDNLAGHDAERRGLEIAAAGGHPVLLMGVPGSARAILAKAFVEILPPMSEEEMKQVQRVYSTSCKGFKPYRRPFRTPHISASMATMLGGGADVLPGEVTLAHNGVLYLDEFAEAPKSIMEGLRGPIEDKKITISRLNSKVAYPTNFHLVLATNPCPCGYYGDGDRCTCTPGQRTAYLSHLSGPGIDRLTMQILAHPSVEKKVTGERAKVVASRVQKAREIQIKRQGCTNDELPSASLEQNCKLSEECQVLMEKLFSQLGLSARSYSRILKIARTIADLAGCEDIQPQQLAEAASYRFLDRRTV